jgi:ADP-heptose:LPS heptosyltransferase
MLINGINVKEFKRTYTLPFNYVIPNSTDVLLRTSSPKSSKVKFIKRKLYLLLKRQSHLEIDKIFPLHQNILWINISAPSLGDSLMDLSSRVMLYDRKIDLYTDKKNAMLYKHDSLINSVFYKLNQVKQNKYDLVIIDSFSTRSVRFKEKIAPLTPFVGMFGYYNGPEVNRVLFSFHQMNKLLGSVSSESEINNIAKPSIFISNGDKKIINSLKLPKDFIAIVIGGEWSFRTFNKWDCVIEKLIKLNKKRKIILIGSYNGIADAKLIIKSISSDYVINLVAKLSFNQTAEVISNSKYIVCCDGGLMHAANAVGAIAVPLLAKLDSDMQLTRANNSFPLFDKINVNNIPVENIVLKCQEASNFADSHHEGE